MKTIEEGNELLPAGGVDRKFQSRLNSFGAAVSEMRARRRGNGNNLIQFLRELWHVAVVIIRPAHMN